MSSDKSTSGSGLTLMNASSNRRPSFLAVALVFEAGLGVAALLVGWLLGHWPLVGLGWLGEPAVAWLWEFAGGVAGGLVGSLPMIGGLFCLDRLPHGSARQLRRIVRRRVVPLFRGLTVAQLALLSLAAGFGEETLFRGLLQAGLAVGLGPPFGPWVGLLVASLVFGLAHWVSRDYAVLAFLVSVYLGLLLIGTGQILVPLVAHAVYDFVALLYLRWGAERTRT